jgi:DNA-binding CsgD family transcriptional regulator
MNGAPGAPMRGGVVNEATESHPAPDVRCGRHEFTGTEMRILRALRRGASTIEIARQLFVYEHTVRERLGLIFGRIGVRDRAEAMAWLNRTAPEPALRLAAPPQPRLPADGPGAQAAEPRAAETQGRSSTAGCSSR